MTWPSLSQGQFVVRIRWDYVHQIWSLYLKPFHRYLKETKSLKQVTWRSHAHFRDVLSSVGWDLHVPNLKCLRLPATKKWKTTPNVKIILLSHSLGLRGNAQGSTMARWKARCRRCHYRRICHSTYSNFAAGSFHTKKLCSSLFSTEVEIYWRK